MGGERCELEGMGARGSVAYHRWVGAEGANKMGGRRR